MLSNRAEALKPEHPKAPKWRQVGRKLATAWDMSFSGQYPGSVCSLVSLTDARGLLKGAAKCSCAPLPDVHLRTGICIPLAQLLEYNALPFETHNKDKSS